MHLSNQLPADSSDTMLLHAAKELAKHDREDWYIVLHRQDLHIAKLMAADDFHFVRVVADDGTALRFISILDAQEFLMGELSVSHKAVYLEDLH